MAVRDGIGKLGKSAPKVDDPNLQRAIDTIYKDLNKVSDGANRPSGTSASRGSLGSSGDIKLYKGHGSDGSTGYFLQARFNDGWATTRLTLESRNPEATEVISDPGQGAAGDEPFITRYGVTFNNLSFTNSMAGQIGDDGLSTLVARGDHKHNHWVLDDPIQLDQNDYDNNGLVTIGDDTHINTIHFPLSPDDHGGSATMVSGDPGLTGNENVAARWDHTHKLDTGYEYVWTADQKFGPQYGNTGITVTINGPSTGTNANALEVYGDVEIDGNLTVGYAETQNNHVDLERNVIMNSANLDNTGANEDYDNKTIVHGPTKFTAGLSVKRSIIDDGINDDLYHYDIADHDEGIPPVIFQDNSANGQLRLAYDESNYFDFKVDTSGNLLLEAKGNIQLKPNIENVDTEEGYILPKGNLVTHLGDIDRQFASIHAGELVVQNIMAMNVMSTIGGQLRVCPTSALSEDLDSATTDYIYLEHDDPNFRNAWIFMQKAVLAASDESTGEYDYIVGDVQFEAIRTKDIAAVSVGTEDAPSYKYEIHTRNADGTGANDWKIKDACVVLYNLGNNKTKGFIELTSTGSVFNTYGPRISLSAAKNGDTAWNAAKKLVTIGNLRSLADYNATDDDNFGMIISNDCTETTTDMKGLTFDQDDGVRLWNTPLNIYSGGTKKVEILKDGSMRLGSSLVTTGDGDTHDDWDIDNSNIGLSWDGDQLIINGIIYVGGDLLSQELEDLQDADAALQDLIDGIPNLDNLSNYASAELISQAFPGNIIGSDWDMEFEPEGGSDYTDMSLWSPNHTSRVQKSTTYKYNGEHSLRLESVNLDGQNTGDATVVYPCNLQDVHHRFPVVPGMKFTARYWYYIPTSTWTNGTPPSGKLRIGLKFFGADHENDYTWKTFCHSGQSTDQWTEANDTFTVPDYYTWYDSDGDGQQQSSEPKYVEPYLVAHSNNDDTNTADTSLYMYMDEVTLMMDSSLAMPANPSGYPGFFAGSDAFGMHDGTYWRTFFGLNANGSVMKLTNSSGTDLVTWDNDVFSIGDKIKLESDGDVKIEGDLKIGDSGSIYSNGGGYGQNGVFLGHVYDGSTEYPMMSLKKNTVELLFDGQNNNLNINNADINMVDGKITVDNANVDVIIGQNIANQNNDDHDDVLIGTWNSQKASSPSGQGILVKHDTIRNENAGDGAGSEKYDYSKIDQDGFNRAGYEYPIYIGSVPECSGWATTRTTDAEYFGIKANKIFDHPRFPVSYEDVVPPGRALLLQISPLGASWNSLYSPSVNFAAHFTDARSKHNHRDYTGASYTGDAFATATGAQILIYKASDTWQTLWHGSVNNLGALFRDNPEGTFGPWTTIIPSGTNVSDLRLMSMVANPGGWGHEYSSTVNRRANYESVTIWEIADPGYPKSLLLEDADNFIVVGGFGLGGGNPF